MRIAHVVRRCQPAEWGETDTTLLPLLDGLREHGADSAVFCPGEGKPSASNPIVKAGHPMQHFHACLPIWGLPQQKRREMMLVGDKLVSFDLLRELRFAPALDIIHAHAIGVIGAISRRAARLRGIPLVVTLPDEAMDLPETEGPVFARRPFWSCDWGKLPGYLLRASRLLHEADAIVTSCRIEAGLLAERFPQQRVRFLPHGVAAARYEKDCTKEAMEAFPEIAGRRVILCLARIEPARNQRWLLYQVPAIRKAYPDALIVFAGPCTNLEYGETLRQCINAMDLHGAVLMTGALPSEDPRLIGLMQHSCAMVLPSIVDPSGLAVIEAWAAGVPVIASRTAGATALIHNDYDGILFDLSNPHTLHDALGRIVSSPSVVTRLTTAGHQRVRSEFDHRQVAGKMKAIYEELIDARFTSMGGASMPPVRYEKAARA